MATKKTQCRSASTQSPLTKSPSAHLGKRPSSAENSPHKSGHSEGRPFKKRQHKSAGGEVLAEGLDGVKRSEGDFGRSNFFTNATAAAAAVVMSAPSMEADEVIEDSQIPDGGPFLVIEDTYGALADNEHEDNESMDEETQVDQPGQSKSTVQGEPPTLFATDNDLATFSHRVDVKHFMKMMGILAAWSARMLERFAELRSEVAQLRRKLGEESSRCKAATLNMDEERRQRLKLETELAVAEEKLTKVSAALGMSPSQ